MAAWDRPSDGGELDTSTRHVASPGSSGSGRSVGHTRARWQAPFEATCAADRAAGTWPRRPGRRVLRRSDSDLTAIDRVIMLNESQVRSGTEQAGPTTLSPRRTPGALPSLVGCRNPAGTAENGPRHGNVPPSTRNRHQRDEPGSQRRSASDGECRDFGHLVLGGVMTRWSKAKLLALLGSVGGALFLWRRPARTTEITVRRRPVDEGSKAE